MNAISTASMGMMSAAQRFDASAQRTAAGGTDLATEAVDQISAEADFQASAKVLRVADQMYGSLLDMKV